MEQTTLYDDLKAAGCELDHHESDLYVRETPEARAIILKHSWARAEPFLYGNTGQVWLDLPFAYAPFWQLRGCTAS